MNTYYVYILKCSDNSYYTGITNNIDRRFTEHQDGENPKSYTFNKRPVVLVFLDLFNDVNEAINFEKQIKGWSRKKKEALIDRNYNLLKKLAICQNYSSHNLYNKRSLNFD